MSESLDKEHEDRAWDALFFLMMERATEAGPSDKEIQEFMKANHDITPEDEEMLKEIGKGLVGRLHARESGCLVVSREDRC